MRITSEAQWRHAREAGVRLARTLRALGSMVTPGISTEELEMRARSLIASMDATPAFLGYQPTGAPRPYPAATCISVGAVAAHGIPTEPPRILSEGEVVTLDVGLRYRGIVVDAARSFVVGDQAPQSVRRLPLAARAVLEAVLARVHAGISLGTVATIAAEHARKWGFRVIPDLCGHGVGNTVHEEPHLIPHHPDVLTPSLARTTLEAGMVVALEPHLTSGRGGIHIDTDGYALVSNDGAPVASWEETVVITEEGCEVLTREEGVCYTGGLYQATV